MKRQNVAWGAILILLGLAFLAFQLFPDLFAWASWTWLVVGVGLVFAVASLLTRTGGLMIPGAIVTGVGAILTWQNATGNWDTWSYIWTLIPGFVGLGMLIGSLYDPELRGARGAGFILLLISGILFAVFGGFFGLSPAVMQYWPVLLILIGLIIFIRALTRPREKSGKSD